MAESVYIVLFRGINVGGNKVARMEVLRKALTDAGFGNVASYIQSGNVVLTSELKAPEIAALIDKTFAATFGFSSRPTVFSLEEWKRVEAGNPFPNVPEGNRVHAVLLGGKPEKSVINALRGLATTEEIEVKGDVLYLYTPDGFGQSKVAAKLDSLLKVPLTARNWNTVIKLREIAEKAAT